MYGHGKRNSRFPELLDQLKVEYESLNHEHHICKMQRDDFERKLEAQLTEVTRLQQALFELERNHNSLKRQYEDELMLVRQQLEGMSDGNGQPKKKARTEGGELLEGANSLGERRNRITDSIAIPFSLQNGRESQLAGFNKTLPSLEVDNRGAPGTSTQRVGAPAAGGSADRRDSAQVKSENDRIRKEGTDWYVVNNDQAKSELDLDLVHNLDHSSVVCCVKFSHDGKTLATGCNKAAELYDVATGQKVCTLPETTSTSDSGDDSYVRSVCFTPDGNYLVAGAEDRTVNIWDIQNKKIQHSLTGHELDIYSLDVSRNGEFVVSGSGDKKAKLWDIKTGTCKRTFFDERRGPADGITSVAVSPDSRFVAAGSLDRSITLWDATTGALLDKLEGHSDSVYSVAFSPDGKVLASGSLDKTLKLWDLSASNPSRCQSTLTGHKDFVLSVAFSSGGDWLVSGSKDRTVQFWDPRHSVPCMMMQGHKNSVISVDLSPTNNVFASGSGDCRARVWNYRAVRR